MVPTPLFVPGIPGGPEVLVLLFILLFVAILPLAISILIYNGAKKRGSNHAIAWGLAAFFGGIVVWLLYLVVREDMGPGE